MAKAVAIYIHKLTNFFPWAWMCRNYRTPPVTILTYSSRLYTSVAIPVLIIYIKIGPGAKQIKFTYVFINIS